MADLILSPPSDRQLLFLQSRTKYTAFGGARGGGKSWAVRTKAVLMAMQYPGITILIIRRTYPELRENHILPLTDILRCYAPDKKDRFGRYNDTAKTITLINGSRIIFGYCAGVKDTPKYQGLEVDVLCVDEATQQDEDTVKRLNACVRGVNGYPKRIYYTCNPGGVGHAWVKRLFIDKIYKDGEYADEYTFIKSLVTDNKALMDSDPDYYKNLMALPPKLRDAWLYGRWDIFDGQFFEEFRERPDPEEVEKACTNVERAMAEHRWTHVIKPFTPPNNWTVYRSYDWGYGKPFSCAWYVVSPDDVIYRILELYGCRKGEPNEGVKWTNEQQFAEIARVEREHPWLRGREIYGVADPSIWDGSKGKSAAQVASEYGVYFKPGVNARIPGWMQIHYRMRFDDNGYCKLYFFDNCEAIIRTMPLMTYDDHVPEDLDSSLEDHACDELRYMCMCRPIAPTADAETQTIANSPLSDDNKIKYGNIWR